MTKRPHGPEKGRRRLRVSIVVGVLLALDVVIVGAAFAKNQPTSWTAESTLLVLPVRSLTAEALPSFYETLSHGQIVATYAEILRSQRFERTAARRMGLSLQAQEVAVSVKVIPDTAVLVVTATAPQRSVAERLAEAVAESASNYVASLNQPYVITSLQPATGTAERSELPKTSFAVVVALVALAAGLAVQQALYQVLTLLGHRRRARQATNEPTPVAAHPPTDPPTRDHLTDEGEGPTAPAQGAAPASSDHDDDTPEAVSPHQERLIPALEPARPVTQGGAVVTVPQPGQSHFQP